MDDSNLDKIEKDRQIKVKFSITVKILSVAVIFGIVPLIVALILSLRAQDTFISLLFPGLAYFEPQKQEAIARFVNLLQFLILSVFAATSGLIVISYILSRSFVGPIFELRSAFRELVKGRNNVRVSVKNQDEFGDLAVHFNEMAEYIDKSREQEDKISTLKSEFISLAAHQIRSPLSGIKWTFKTLLDGDLGELNQEQKESLERAYAVNERLISLVTELLDVSRIEQGKVGYNFKPADLEDIIAGTIEEFKLVAQNKNIEISFLRSPKPLPPISLDEERLELALNNLLTNAINYTLKGGKVMVSIELGIREVKVTVQDTGVGIPRVEISKLFNKFFRASNVVKMQTTGTGLGLFIVRNIIEKHGGKIWVESEENEGSSFVFTLPLENHKKGFVADNEMGS